MTVLISPWHLCHRVFRLLRDRVDKTHELQDRTEMRQWEQMWLTASLSFLQSACCDPENNTDIKQLITSCWATARVCFYVCVVLCEAECCSIESPPSLLPHSVCLFYLLLFSALLLFISLPPKPQSSLPPIFFSFFISYYSPATRLIRPLNWASGRQSLSPRRHQAKQHPAATVTGSRQRLER